MTSDVIFETIHGSRLYGLFHEGSDKDIYRLVNTFPARRKARHKVNEDADLVEMPLLVFMTYIWKGSHQSLEALFSPFKVWNPKFDYYRPIIETYRVGGAAVFSAYRRTITSFCYGDYKKRRHAVRLRGNLEDLYEAGRFNPIMSDSDITRADFLARHYEGDALRELLLEKW